MPRFYREKLSKTLAEAVERQLACSPHEQLQVFEELALLREMAGDAAQLWAVAKELCAKESTPQNQLILTEAERITKDALLEVVRVGEAGARIQAMCKDKLTPHNLQAVVNQLVRVLHDECKGNPELEAAAMRIEATIAREVRVVDVARGTDLTPDVVAREMDETVLGGDVDEENEDGEEESR